MKLQLQPEDVSIIVIIKSDVPDETTAVLQIAGKFDGVLIKDNSGWSYAYNLTFDETVALFEGEGVDTCPIVLSADVRGIAVQLDITTGEYKVVPAVESERGYYLV